MANQNAGHDDSHVPTLLALSNAADGTTVTLYADPTTHRLLTQSSSGGGTVTEVDTGTGLTGGPITTTGTIALDSKLAPLDTLGTAGQSVRVNAGATALEYYTPSIGSGTVTSVSVASANGFAGTVANATTTPAITLSTTNTAGSVLFSDGTALQQDNAQFFWDDTNHRLGIGTAVPTSSLTIASTGSGVGIYNTTDQVTNFELGQMFWSTNALNLATSKGGTGSSRSIRLATTNTSMSIADTASSSGFYIFSRTTGTPGAYGTILGGNGVATWGASSGVNPILAVQATIAQSGSAGYTGILSNITESSTGSGAKLLADFQTGGVSRVNISSGGTMTFTGTSSGSVTLKAAAAAGTGTNFQLPTTNGSSTNVLTTDGSGNTSWAAATTGTVTSVSVASSNGFTGSSSGGATPALTIATSVTGILQGNGTAISAATTTGSGSVVLATSPTITFANSGLNLSGSTSGTAIVNAPSSGGGTLTLPAGTTSLAGLGTAQTFTGQDKFNNFIDVNNAVTVTSNAGTVPVTFRLNTFTNSSAATMAITMATASAVDGQMTIVRIYDFSGVAQTIGWTNTENSTVSVPATSNGSTSLPLTVGFMFNGSTTKWRCIAVA